MAAAPTSFADQLREELTCSICLELFTRPKVLLCGHTFCQDCLLRIAERERPFRCPADRQQVRMPLLGVLGLPDNRIVTNLFEKFHLTPVQRENQPQRITFGGSGWGLEAGHFTAVTVSEEGEIFVADNSNQRIQVFTLQGTFVRQFPTVVSGGQKMRPNDVAMDGEGNLWVVGDTGPADFAVKYNKQGGVLTEIEIQHNYANWHKGVAVDTRRNLILITENTGDWDKTQGKVLVFGPDQKLLKTICQEKGMNSPENIAVNEEGNILVSDKHNHCVYVYNGDGQFLFKFGGRGGGQGRLNQPCGICTDKVGNIIVADTWNGRVELFDKTGRFLKHIATDIGGSQAVAMAPQGQLVVAGCYRNTIIIFPQSDLIDIPQNPTLARRVTTGDTMDR